MHSASPRNLTNLIKSIKYLFDLERFERFLLRMEHSHKWLVTYQHTGLKYLYGDKSLMQSALPRNLTNLIKSIKYLFDL